MPIGKGNVNAKTLSATEQCYADAILPESKGFDSLAFIMDYEGGELSFSEIIAGFKELIKSGLVWSLQGSYGRTAKTLIEQGYI